MEERFNFNVILNSFLILIPINIFIVFMMTVYRFVFFLYFADFGALSSLKMYVFKAFWMGFRFDLSILAYINIPITLALLVCLILKSDLIFELSISLFKYYYTLIFSLLFLVMFVDFGFFSYFKDHYNLMIFGVFEDDTIALLKTIFSDYRFYVALIFFAIVCLVIYKVSVWTYKELKFNERIINSLYWRNSTKFIVIMVIIAVNFIAARGSFSMFPLGLFYAEISPDYFINKLCVNPVHPLADTIYYKIKNSNKSMNLKDIFKYKNDNEIINDLKNLSINSNIQNIEEAFVKKTPENKMADKIKPNVIFIVMEGFGELPVLNNTEQFNVLGELKKHFEQDSVFYNFLPAGFITIHAIESIILNVPQRPLVSQITQTEDSFKHFLSSAALPYKNAGYHSIAVYGGSMTWRDLESFYKAQGFDETIGEGNVSISAKDRHAWGINDAQFFKLLEEQLYKDTDNKSKFIFAMSTGTHPPYKIPEGYVPLQLNIPEQIKNMMSSKDLNNKAIFDVYQFANRELAKFISMIKKSDFAENTIIAVTGDHNLRELSNYSKEDMFLRYAVPFYLYIPKQLKNKIVNTNIFGSHMDIMPTLYGLSLSSAAYVSFGNDLINNTDNISFNIDGLIVRDDIAVKYNFVDGSMESFTFDKNSRKLTLTKETEQHKHLLNYYKAVMTVSDMFIKDKI